MRGAAPVNHHGTATVNKPENRDLLISSLPRTRNGCSRIALKKTGYVHIGSMIDQENIIPCGIVRRFKNIFMPDTQEEIPAIRPYLGHTADQVASPAFSKKRKIRTKEKQVIVKKDEPEQGIDRIDLPGE